MGKPPEHREILIEQVSRILDRLMATPEGPAREDLEAELRQLARLLWLDRKV
jgi:hypothetical protein